MSRLDRLPRALWFPALCGVLVALPTIAAGLFMDDALARVKLLGLDTPWSPAPWWDLYTFARPDLNAGLRAAGQHPWWADPELKMTFFRPLAALTHHLDYRLWPNHPALQHLHSVAWYGGGVALVTLLFRRLQGSARSALVAALVFAVATPHVMTVGWLAGRNTLIAFVLGCLTLGAHLRGVERSEMRWRALGVALFAIGLLASEAILGVLGYIFAWHLCLDDRAVRARVLAGLPFLVVLVGWRWAYVEAGFGSAFTSIYHDPATDLGDFARAQLIHLPVLLLGRWLPVPLDFWSIISAKAQVVVVGAGVGLGLLLLWAFRRPLRTRVGRFWGLGMLLALLPFCATVPMDRLTLFAGLGFAGLVGACADGPPSRGRRILLFVYLPLAALFALGRAATLGMNFAPNTSGFAQAPHDAAVPQQTFVSVNGTFHRTHYTTLMRRAAGEPAPHRAVTLTSMAHAASLTRLDARTVEVTPDGGYLRLGVDRIHRRLDRPFMVGARVRLPDVTIEVVERTADGRPARARFVFDVPLEDARLRWLQVVPGELGFLDCETRPFPLPAIGETVRIASVL